MKSPPPASGPFQLVYLSVRPHLLERSLESLVRHYGADRAVVLTADRLKPEMEAVLAKHGLAPVVLTDSQVLADHESYSDHGERNSRLRAALYLRDEIEDFFLALDDDSVLLRDLPDDYFVAGGRMVARYCQSAMSRWKASSLDGPTSFDKLQWSTAGLLLREGFGELCFAAHQPQILDKVCVNAVLAEFLPMHDGPADEWSLYFNVACARQPDRFDVRPATTLFWPESFDSWLPDWFEDDARFENHYPWLYEDGGALAKCGIGFDCDWRIKRQWAAARYAAGHAQRMLNELSCGEPPLLSLKEDGGSALASNARQLFGFPGAILKLAVDVGDAADQRVDYTVLKANNPVADSMSPRQSVGARQDLAVRLPAEAGEYALVIKWVLKGKATYLSLPLFVLPYPAL
ncbi:MAG: hypothetical protein KDJ90_03935 [Nitratireductor sp.]|nr:hypothetical protein [Nitratireductor sp.]